MNHTNKADERTELVSISYKLVPLPSGCSNCWGDLGEGCSDECRASSARHSEKIDEAIKLISTYAHNQTLQARIDETTMWQSVAGASGILEVSSFKHRIASLEAEKEQG